MSLPTLSTLNTTQDTNKQLSIIRSYLVQLKDELEAELSNVTYEMLSASLQKRIDAIDDDIANNKSQGDIIAQMVTTQYAKVGDLVADAISTAELYAKKVSTEALDTANANISTLNTTISNTYMAKATYLDAGTAKINMAYIPDLSADKITSGTINSARINAGQIVSNGLTVNRITAACSAPNEGSMYMGTMYLNSLRLYTAPNTYSPVAGRYNVTVGSYTYRLIGYQL